MTTYGADPIGAYGTWRAVRALRASAAGYRKA